jgi:hypothetical protein
MEHYSARYAAAQPEELSSRCGALFSRETFHVTMLGQPLRAAWPDFSLQSDSEECSEVLLSFPAQLLVIRFLLEGARAPACGRFLTYRELPWGAVYDKTFHNRCVRRLAFSFGSRLDEFSRAADKLGGIRLNLGDAAVELPFFEEIRVRVILYAGDDEFPPTAQILFSDNAAVAFSAEDLAAVGDIVISALKAHVT